MYYLLFLTLFYTILYIEYTVYLLKYINIIFTMSDNMNDNIIICNMTWQMTNIKKNYQSLAILYKYSIIYLFYTIISQPEPWSEIIKNASTN